MFAVPVVIVRTDGTHEFNDGHLIKLHAELCSVEKISKYASLTKRGWHRIDYGAFAFTEILGDGTIYVFPGILIAGEKSKLKRDLKIDFTKAVFEDFIAALISREETYRLKAEQDLNLLVHDLRALSTSIYHQAEGAKEAAAAQDHQKLMNFLNSIIATQTMLGIRTDVLDFSGSLELQQEKRRVPIYRRVDKVVRCFRPMAEKSSVELNLIGSSRSYSFGPNAFEIVAYVIIDNAIKYAPRNSEVEIRVVEVGGRIQVIFQSIGPDILPKEKEKIFTKGYRSISASEREASGSGVGLYLAKRIVEQFDGKIWVEVSGRPITTSMGNSRNISFVVSIPIYVVE